MQAALFDLDGVIVDTEPTYSRFWGEMGRKYNTGIDNFADIIKGTTLTQILGLYFPDPEVRRQIVDELEAFERNMDYNLFPDIIAYLEHLRACGVKCAIVTSSNLEKMGYLMQKHPELEQYFDAIVTDEDVTRSKPDPEPYLVAAERLGIPPSECVVYEDSFNGLLSGRAARATVVALTTTNPASTLNDKADIVASSFTELMHKNL